MMSGQGVQNGRTGATLVIVPATGGTVGALADIGGMPMVVQTWRRAVDAQVGRVVVATAEPGVAEAVSRFGGQAIKVTAVPHDTTGASAAALEKLDPGREMDVVMVLRGDHPTIRPRSLERCLEPLAEPAVDIATLAAPIVDEADRLNPSMIKAILALTPGRAIARVTDFTRITPPEAEGTQFRHIEIYAYRRTVIDNFVLLPPSVRETRHKLEQLRALDAGMRVDAALVDTAPARVDTPADLEHVRAALSAENDSHP